MELEGEPDKLLKRIRRRLYERKLSQRREEEERERQWESGEDEDRHWVRRDLDEVGR